MFEWFERPNFDCNLNGCEFGLKSKRLEAVGLVSRFVVEFALLMFCDGTILRCRVTIYVFGL
jgi:hypothetical protein